MFKNHGLLYVIIKHLLIFMHSSKGSNHPTSRTSCPRHISSQLQIHGQSPIQKYCSKLQFFKNVQQKWHKTLVTPQNKIPNSKIRPEHGDKNHSSRGCHRIKPDFRMKPRRVDPPDVPGNTRCPGRGDTSQPSQPGREI